MGFQYLVNAVRSQLVVFDGDNDERTQLSFPCDFIGGSPPSTDTLDGMMVFQASTKVLLVPVAVYCDLGVVFQSALKFAETVHADADLLGVFKCLVSDVPLNDDHKLHLRHLRTDALQVIDIERVIFARLDTVRIGREAEPLSLDQ